MAAGNGDVRGEAPARHGDVFGCMSWRQRSNPRSECQKSASAPGNVPKRPYAYVASVSGLPVIRVAITATLSRSWRYSSSFNASRGDGFERSTERVHSRITGHLPRSEEGHAATNLLDERWHQAPSRFFGVTEGHVRAHRRSLSGPDHRRGLNGRSLPPRVQAKTGYRGLPRHRSTSARSCACKWRREGSRGCRNVMCPAGQGAQWRPARYSGKPRCRESPLHRGKARGSR